MKIKIVAVGKLKEKYLVTGVQEFVKRLQPYCSLEIVEVAEGVLVDNPSTAQLNSHFLQEGERVLKHIPDRAHVFLLDLHGEQFSSEGLSAKLDALSVNGYSCFVFVIGGAFGVGTNLQTRANSRWSFSKLTFTHQMIRLLLVEQIYRTFKISKGEKYHW